ncbi:MAG: hypothetical protein ACXVJP_10900 [Mucilaginibacter sp.]
MLSLSFGLIFLSLNALAQRDTLRKPPPRPRHPSLKEVFSKINPFKKHKKDSINADIKPDDRGNANKTPAPAPEPPPAPKPAPPITPKTTPKHKSSTTKKKVKKDTNVKPPPTDPKKAKDDKKIQPVM